MNNKTIVAGVAISLGMAAILNTTSAEPIKIALNDQSSPIANSQRTLILSAPPLASSAEGRQRYEPFAQYLTQVLGQKVVYKHPRNWSQYRSEMTSGNYDLVFDSAHFNSYRVEKLKHNILVKLPEKSKYAVFINRKNSNYKNLNKLAGRSICAYAPPHLATLMVNSEFKNPMRQPIIKNTEGWNKIYDNVVKGKCDAGILPVALLKNIDKSKLKTRVIYRTKTIPGQALSASPNITKKDQLKISKALLVAAAMGPTSKLRDAFNSGTKGFAPTKNIEYVGMASLLKSEWGYYQ